MSDAGTVEEWVYQGGTFTNTDSWLECGGRKFTELKGETSIYNLDYEKPLESGYYFPRLARGNVPSNYRKKNLIITFKLSSEITVIEQFIGESIDSNWVEDYNWINLEVLYFLEYETDKSTTRKKIPSYIRKAGIIISYLQEGIGWITEQYIGTQFSDSVWILDSNWEQFEKTKNVELFYKRYKNEYIALRNSLCLLNTGLLDNSQFMQGIGKKGSEIGEELTDDSNPIYAYIPILVFKGMTFKVYSYGGSSIRIYNIVDSDGKILSVGNSGTNSTKNPITISIEDEKSYICYVNSTNFETTKDLTKITAETNKDIESRLDKVETEIEKLKTYWDFPELTGNMYQGSPNEIGGTVIPYTYATGAGVKIPCKNGDKFNIKARGGATAYKYYVTDSDNKILLISKVSDVAFKIETLSISEENAAYLYVNTLDASNTPYTDAFVEKIGNDTQRVTDAATEVFTVKCSGKPWADDNLFTVRDANYLMNGDTYEDYCYYKQPECKEKPCKLVLYCHGGGQGVTAAGGGMDFKVNDLLTKLGYAQLVCNCYPDSYMGKLGLPTGGGNSAPVLNWTIPQQYVAAYKYVVEKYNIDTNGVYLLGMSQGGGSAENVAELTDLPIVAECIMAPAISLQYIQTEVRPTYVAAIYGINSVEEFTRNKAHGLDPFTRNIDSENVYSSNTPTDEECRNVTVKKYRKNIPLLILQGEIDGTCRTKYVETYAKMIRNAGGLVEMIIYEGIQHADLILGNAGTLDGESYGAPSIEVARWFEKFGGNSTDNIVIS